VPVKTITFDFWGTLLFDGPGSDDRYKNRRLSEFETLLGSAGISVTAAALDRAYDESGTYLARIWATSKDVPVQEHVRARVRRVRPRESRDEAVVTSLRVRSGWNVAVTRRA